VNKGIGSKVSEFCNEGSVVKKREVTGVGKPKVNDKVVKELAGTASAVTA
jgi:hypothetical protein